MSDINSVNFTANRSSYAKMMKIHSEMAANMPECRIENALNFVNHSSATKSDVRSVEFREKGNTLYAKGRNDEAIEMYGKSVQCATSTSLNLAKAYGNRSAVLLALNDHTACIGDVKSAIEIIVSRKSTEVDTGDNLERIDAHFVLLSKLESRLSKAIDLLPTDDDTLVVPHVLTGGENPQATGLSSKVAISCLPGRGRGLTAKEDIQFGDLLIVEDAYVAYNSTKLSHIYCHHCMQRLSGNWIPCEKCSHFSIKFCDTQCRAKADAYHKWECGWMAPLLFENCENVANPPSPPKSSKAIRILLSTDPREILEHAMKKENLENYGVAEDQSFGPTYKCMMSLVCHIDIDPQQFEAVTEILQKAGYFDTWPKAMHIAMKRQLFARQAAGLVSRLQCNSVGIMSLELDSEQSVKEVEGCWPNGIHMVSSLINHACQSNVIKLFDGRTTYVRALTNIAAGDELLHSYRPRFGQWTRAERREFTKYGYDFECECEPCTSDEYLAKELELTAFLCISCHSTIHPPKENVKLQCHNCNFTQPYGIDVADIQISRANSVLLSQPISVKQELECCVADARKVLHPHNRHLTDMTMSIARAMSNCYPKFAAELFEATLPVFEVYYRQGSTEFEDCLARACCAHLKSLHDKDHTRELCKQWIGIIHRIYGHKIGRRSVNVRFGKIGVKLFDSLYKSLIM